jgi:hypothetical protein
MRWLVDTNAVLHWSGVLNNTNTVLSEEEHCSTVR